MSQRRSTCRSPTAPERTGPLPELLEVEAYRRATAVVVGGVITAVQCPDPRFLRRTVDAAELSAALADAAVVAVERRGKVMLVCTDAGHTLGVRFAMTGRVIVDGHEPIPELKYGPRGGDTASPRFIMSTTAGTVTVVDPRRLGSLHLDPDLTQLGPDASTLSVAELRSALECRRPLKAVLLDQGRVAGLGNLLADESLWRARLAPGRPALDLDMDEERRLARTIVATVAQLGRRGGSHTGDLQAARDARGACPRCGTPLQVARIGGRTTLWCPVEQR